MGKRPPPKRLPEPLPLKKHLNGCTVPELEEFRKFWEPHEKSRSLKRAQLVDHLFRLMSDENVVYAKVDLLSERVRAVLMQLLRKMHYTSDLQGLFRGIDGLDLEHYEGEAALTALARRGFVRQSRAQEWLHYGRTAFAIPREIALAMRGLAGTDRRPLAQIFRHAMFKPSSVEAGSADDLPALPASIHDAIDALPAPLASLATTVMEQHGGLTSRHEFQQSEEHRIAWQSAKFLRAFGGAGLGTVGHVDLRTRGIGVDDDALLFFTEAVERYVAEWRDAMPAHDVVLVPHGYLMSDMCTALDAVREGNVKVSKEGAVYKSSRGRIAERLQFPEQPLFDRIDLADRVLGLVRALGLASVNGDSRLAITDKGESWAELPLLEKIDGAHALLLVDGTQTLRSRHLRGMRTHLMDLLTAEDGCDVWWPGASLGFIARNRYLLELAEDDATTINGAQLSVRSAALTELGRAAQDVVSRDLFALGLVEVALAGDEVCGVRLSRLGRRLLCGRAAERGTETKPLVVNPDFEMLVLPEGDIDELLHGLDRIAVRVGSGEVVRYQLDRERVERVTVGGESPDTLIDFLRAHARAALPQNVVYSIRSW
ncbi:MAG: helicase-associated domain-containing protein, partial [Planctomycetota bacterium]|nr:helicase-associated domain-containing protein [Planctomycetota bacterium]